tara:strand:+ start:690 stop:905 length:216 start_codon:yes stop_codon:yes gene_type:complete
MDNKKLVVGGAIGLALISVVGAWATYNKVKKGDFLGRSTQVVKEIFNGVEPTPFPPADHLLAQEWHETFTA